MAPTSEAQVEGEFSPQQVESASSEDEIVVQVIKLESV